MKLKSLTHSLFLMSLALFAAFGALAVEDSAAVLKTEILTDLKLLDEVDSLNQGQAAKIWLLPSDEDSQDKDFKGLSGLDQ
jgi:hypothetical protein